CGIAGSIGWRRRGQADKATCVQDDCGGERQADPETHRPRSDIQIEKVEPPQVKAEVEPIPESALVDADRAGNMRPGPDTCDIRHVSRSEERRVGKECICRRM